MKFKFTSICRVIGSIIGVTIPIWVFIEMLSSGYGSGIFLLLAASVGFVVAVISPIIGVIIDAIIHYSKVKCGDSIKISYLRLVSGIVIAISVPIIAYQSYVWWQTSAFNPKALCNAFDIKEQDLFDIFFSNGDNKHIESAEKVAKLLDSKTFAKTLERNPSDMLDSLFCSLNNDNIESLKFLIDVGVNVNAVKNDCNYTPLMLAATKNKEMVKILLDSGAAETINTQSCDNDTAIYNASRADNVDIYDITKLLIEHGANVNVRNRSGNTPLTNLLYGSSGETILLLLEQENIDVNSTNHNQKSALDIFYEHFAKDSRNEKYVKKIESALLKKGAKRANEILEF